MLDFIDNLPMSSVDKGKLRQLGADSLSVCSLMEAAPNAFASSLGPAAARIENALVTLIPSASPRLPATRLYSLGTNLSAAPPLPPPPFNLARRDQLFAEWQTRQQFPSTKVSPRAQELETAISSLIER